MILSGELDEPLLSSHFMPTARPYNLKTTLTILGQRHTRSSIWECLSAPIVPGGWRGVSLAFNCGSVSISLRAALKPERA
jgi:hypothetical protein